MVEDVIEVMDEEEEEELEDDVRDEEEDVVDEEATLVNDVEEELEVLVVGLVFCPPKITMPAVPTNATMITATTIPAIAIRPIALLSPNIFFIGLNLPSAH